MKRFAMAAIAAATFAAPLAIASTASADPGHGRGRGHDRADRHDRDYDNRDDRRDERRSYRDGRRDGRQHARWDQRRHNGYSYQGQWYYGPPPAAYYGYEPGYRQWRRGDRLPSYYRDRYREVDYRYHRLRPPPRGYHYVRDDNSGEYLLVGIATGVILGAILAGN